MRPVGVLPVDERDLAEPEVARSREPIDLRPALRLALAQLRRVEIVEDDFPQCVFGDPRLLRDVEVRPRRRLVADEAVYAMKPATRQRFDEARTALQDPDRWPSEAAERTVNRIIRVCWERGWRLEEKAA